MHLTRKLIEERVKDIDVVIEVLDASIQMSRGLHEVYDPDKAMRALPLWHSRLHALCIDHLHRFSVVASLGAKLALHHMLE